MIVGIAWKVAKIVGSVLLCVSSVVDIPYCCEREVMYCSSLWRGLNLMKIS